MLLSLDNTLETLTASIKERYDISCQYMRNSFTLLDYVMDASRLITERNISICLATSDEAVILLGALIKEHSQLRGVDIPCQ